MPDTGDIGVKVTGMKELQAKQEQMVRDLGGTPMLQAMKKATLLVEAAWKRSLGAYTGDEFSGGVDTGQYRASIVPDIADRDGQIVGIVGTNLAHAPYVEYGTKPHWPPPGALEVWARRHGMDEYIVRKAISVKGTRAHKNAERAFNDNLDKIKQYIGDATGEIVKK
ncbi:MAG: HK97 gp10 family phage protein [Parcubacteria group bacterium]